MASPLVRLTLLARSSLYRGPRGGLASKLPLVVLSPQAGLFPAPPTRGVKTKGKSAPGAASSPAPAEDDAGDIEGEVAASSPKDLKSQMQKQVDYAKRELSKLRGATASPNMLDHITVEAYGERQTLTSVAQIALKSPTLIVVNPFDSALADAIGDAIRDADLNLNPQVEGSVVRVPVPKASKETKEATVKLISKIAETAKNRIRRVRQAAMDKIKKVEGVSTDDTFREMKDIQTLTTDATEQVVKIAEKKKLEIESG